MRGHLQAAGENIVIFGVDRIQGIFTQTWSTNEELIHQMQQLYPISFNKFDYAEFIQHLSPAQIEEFEQAQLPDIVEGFDTNGTIVSTIKTFKEFILAYTGLRNRIATGTLTEQDMAIKYISNSNTLNFDVSTKF